MRGGVCVVLGALVQVAHAEPALDKPAFTASAAELLAAAKAKPAGTVDVFVLREDEDIAFDERGRITSHWHMIFVVASQAGADDWGGLSTTYLPSYQDKPKIRARVIDPSGAVSELDQTRIADSPTSTTTVVPEVRRRLESTLPKLQIGSIVEEEFDSSDRDALPGGGAIETFLFSHSIPVVSARLTISAPAKRKLHVVAKNVTVKPRSETRDGRQRLTYVAGPFAATKEDDRESSLPPDAIVGSFISVSLSDSWRAVASAYRDAVDKKIAEAPVAFPADVPKAASLESVNAIVNWVHRNVRIDAISFHDASVIPATPAETLKRGLGDAKDKATLLVALLRQAGVTADIALINVGPGVDIDREMVGLDAFDDVLVRVTVGGKELWIDPSSSASRVGQLQAANQGRLALIVAASTTGLITTPTATAADNVSREIRTFEVAEIGAAKVTEVSRNSGSLEVSERAWFRDGSADSVRKNLEEYVASQYAEAKLERYTTSDAGDVAKPFEATVVATGSRRAYSERMRADVYLFPTDVLAHLPDELSHSDEKTRVRKNDFMMAIPHITEIENRIIVPIGFTMPTPAPDRSRDLGTMKLVEQQRVDGQTFVVTFRLDTGKARIRPGDVTRVQEAVRALRKEGSLHIVLDNTASALSAHGKYQDAIAEARRVIALHPKEALHHSQLATILLHAGAGEAARREARKGTEVEPTSADAFAVLGWMLTHDTFAHFRGFDHDRAGAVAAYEKAHKLDPKHVGALVDLARLLERSPQGRLYDSGSDVKRAIAMWRAAREIDDDDETSLSLIRALLWTGQAADAEAVARSMQPGETRNSLLVAAVAIGSGGPSAAIRLADSLGTGTARSKMLQQAGATLMLDRHYDAMRALFAELGTMKSSPYNSVLQNLARHATAKHGQAPEDIVMDAVIVLSAAPKSAIGSPLYIDKRVAEELARNSTKNLPSASVTNNMNSEIVVDMLRSSAHMSVETEGAVSRVELELAGFKSGVYVAAQKATSKIIGASDAPAGVGRYVLTLLAKNDEKTSTRVLDWLAAEPDMRGRPFARIWGTNLPRTKQEMELAAAVLTGSTDTARAIPILKRCGATTTDGQLVCDLSLAEAYADTQNWVELDDHAQAWSGRLKQDAMPIGWRLRALTHLGRFDEAERVLADALKAFPDDDRLTYTRIDLAYAKNDSALAVKLGDDLAKGSNPTAQHLNLAAWTRLVDGSDLANAHLLARRALQVAGDEPNIQNTMAAIAAETNDLAEAKENLDRSMRAEDGPPVEADWYVHGRILEQLGLSDDAIAAYRKVASQKSMSFVPESAHLAARRLKALGAVKK